MLTSSAARSVLLIGVLLLATLSSAQVGLKVMQIRPMGEFGAVMERAITAEVMYLEDFEGNWRWRVFFSATGFKPRLEKFPVYATVTDNDGTRVLGGYQTFHKYVMYMLGAGLDHGFELSDRLHLYPGFTVMFGGINMEYETLYPTYEEEHFSGGRFHAGLGIRAGADYAFSDLLAIFLELEARSAIIEATGIQSHSSIGLGARITF